MESQIQSKKKLEKELTILNNQQKTSLNIIPYNTLIYIPGLILQLKVALNQSRLHHNKKLIKFRKSQQKYIKSPRQTELVRNIVHSVSSYALSCEELTDLSYGLDHHISKKANRNAVSTEFEHFFQKIFPIF